MPKINFFNEDISYKPKHISKLKAWITNVVKFNGAKIKEVNYIFCSDEYLKKVNIEYLDHHYYTDIITFDNSDLPNILEADIFISIDRIKENSLEQGEQFDHEFRRVLIHGILHLLGFNDKEEDERKEMRLLEDKYLKDLDR